MEITTKIVTIPTFVNPHLFWIIETNSDERTKTLNNINKIMQDKYKTYEHELNLNDSFEVGEIVAVPIENMYCRAIIEDVLNVETKSKGIFCFLCWFIDFGCMYESKVVYKLPSSLRKVNPLALQASLNNVAYVRQHLTYDHESGLPVKTGEPVSSPTSTAHQVSLELISNLSDLKFQIENKVDGVLLGDILFKENQEFKSLREILIEKGILIFNVTIFKEIRENIYSYKEAHLLLISQISKKLNSIQFLKENPNKSWCENIISKYLTEFEDSDSFGDVELTRPLHMRRSRSRNTGNDSQNSINSGTDSISDVDMTNKCESSSSFNEKSPGKSRAELLLEKMKKQRHSIAKAQDILSDGNKKDDSPSTSTPYKEKLSVNERKNTTQSDSGTEECKRGDVNPALRKRVIPNNAVFIPGGATFSLAHKKKKPTEISPKQTSQAPKISSDDDTSDCVTVDVSKKCIADRHNSTDDNSVSEENKVENDEVAQPQINDPVKQLQVKPFCTCKQCEHWTSDNDWRVDVNFLDECKEPKHLTVNKPQNLFLSKDENLTVERTIIPLNYSSKTKLQKQATPKLLVHGEYSQTPVKLMSEVYLHDCIRNSLYQLNYREAKRIQMYAWPAILRQQHVLMVNGPQTGKTMAYLPVILTFLLEKNERYESFVAKTGGPIVVVLCATTKKCEEIYDLSKILLGRNKLRIFLITYPLSHVNAKHIDMLITTPAILIDLLKAKAINFKRLCHIVLEDGDKILKQEFDIMNRVFDLTQSMLSNRVHPKPVQLIICSEHWNSPVENLVQKLSKMPVICIGNHLEAALYGKMQFSMKFTNSACKEHELKNLLKDTFKILKSIILCKNEEIDDIETILMLKGIDAIIIKDDMNKEDIFYSEEVWTQSKGGEYTVLVCTDFILSSLLTITSASLLIHYSLPNSWTQFVKRFGCLLENCRSPFDNKEAKIKSCSVVLCDEECEEHMFKFFSFIGSTELKNQLPDKFKQFSKDLKYTNDQKKIKDRVGLCHTLKLFGTCSVIQCPWRHIIDKNSDISDYLPQSGKIKFKIIHIHDVTTYSVQLIQHIDMENNVHEYIHNSDISEDLTDLVKMSRKQVIHPVVGHYYAYYDKNEIDGVYYRCYLLEIDSDSVRVKLLDKGDVIKTGKNRLFKLPKEFRNQPRRVVDVYLANFIPPYHDENFSAKSFFNLKRLLEEREYNNMILTADIHLQADHSLWLKNVYEEVTLAEKLVPKFQLTREILLLKLAEHSNDPLNNLYKLCKEASVSLPPYEKVVQRPIKEERRIEPQWAHLDADVNAVTFSAAISPNEIYIRLNKCNQQLYSLQKEIQESLKKPHYPKLQNVNIGSICLAKDPEGIDYARTVVKNIEDGKALCLFVDFGDEIVSDISELKHIHNKFITKLPFQSIQCRLHGINSVLDDWQDDINSILYEYATEPNSDIFRLLFAKVCSKEKNEIHPKQNKYSVLLKDGFGEKRVLLNNLLIECGVAVPNSEPIDDFDISITDLNSDESDEELEQIIDICRKTKEVEENVCVNDYRPSEDMINEDMELFLIDADEFFKSLLAVKNDTKTENTRELPAIQAAPPVDYYTPEVYWSQTDTNIKVDIKLPDVHEYTLHLNKGIILHFKTVKNEKTYKLNLMLYQKVNLIQHTSMGPQIRATMSKVNNVEWPRLILSKQRARNIHYDTSTMVNAKEETKKFLEFPTFSDEDESDDNNIDVMYHVVSDIDSDMDADAAEDSN